MAVRLTIGEILSDTSVLKEPVFVVSYKSYDFYLNDNRIFPTKVFRIFHISSSGFGDFLFVWLSKGSMYIGTWEEIWGGPVYLKEATTEQSFLILSALSQLEVHYLVSEDIRR